MTYNKPSEGQYYYDCNFTVPVDIPPGPNGLYQVTFDEVLFQHSHAVIEPGDYIKINIPGDVSYTITFSGYNYTFDMPTFITFCNTQLESQSAQVEVIANPTTENGIIIRYKEGASVSGRFTLECTVNLGYVFNNLNTQIWSESIGGQDIVSFPVTRTAGPFLYIINTNLIPEVPAVNEKGQTFNLSLMTYNTTHSTEDLVQMASTMRLLTSNITNLHFKLINDQGDIVKINSPIYMQITISPYIPPASTSNIGYYK